MKFRKNVFLYFLAMNIAYAGTVSDLIDYQIYRDFAMNKGKFKVGATNIVIERKDGTSKIINVPMLDFATTSETANGTLIDPNYIAGVKHTNGYQTVTYGYKTGHTYKLIDRNQHGSRDYHTPRLSKVVTDVAPTKYKQDDTAVQEWGKKYSMFARVGTGMQYVQDANGNKEYLSYAYKYYTGGIISSDMLYKGIWINDREGNFVTSVENSPLPIYIEAGDSGSPLWGFNVETQEWELVAFAMSITTSSSIYIPVIKDYMEKVMNEDTLPNIEDVKSEGELVWGAVNTEEGSNTGTGIITQGDKKWTYNGLKSDLDLSEATNDELNFTKHLTFAGEGGTIKLEDSINMGAGKLTFKNDYTVKGETGKETWVGAGIEIDKDKKVLWQVNGVAGDALHKIGEGTLHINATGINQGALNVGDGTVILDQQADADGKKQAFDYIDIVSGRATVVLNDAEQIDTSKINFLFRGGRLDVNGNEIEFGDINAVDSGAMIVNHNSDKKAVVNIDTDKFKNDTSIYHGQFGEYDEDRTNGEMDINIDGSSNKTFAITGGSTLNGDFNLAKGTFILSGGRDLHAGEDIKKTTVNGDYYYSQFDFNNINMSQGTEFQGSVYSVLNGNINTEGSNRIILGYVDGESKLVYDSTQETKEQTATEVILTDEIVGERFKEETTFYKGNISLNQNSNLKVGYTQIEGNITQEKSDSIINKTTLNGNLNLYNFSNSAISDSTISGNINLSDSHLVLKDTQVIGTVAAEKGKMNLYSTVWTITGDSQVDTLLIGDNTQIHFNKKSLTRSTDEFSNLTVNNFSGSTAITFNTDSTTGKSDKVIINNLETENSEIQVSIKDNASSNPNYGGTFNLMEIKSDKDKSISIVTGDKSNNIDIGSVKVNIQVKQDVNGNVAVDGHIPDELDKNTSGSTTTTILQEYAARMELIKSQKNLIEESMVNMNKENFEAGISYIGSYSKSKYESDRFRDYDQRIINNGVTFESENYIDSNWNLYKGMSFIYGKSSIDYDGNYSGSMENYTGSIYGQIIRNDGLFLNGNLGVSYINEEINSTEFNTKVLNLGAGMGIDKNYGELKVRSSLNFNTYYLPKLKYSLKFDQNLQEANIKDEFVLEISPEIRVSKNYYYGKSKITTYGSFSYDFNKCLNSKNLEIITANNSAKTELIENGAVVKVGTDINYENVGIGLELKYYTGEYSAEKISGELKLKYRF